jgi:hypothetical protein
MAPTRSKKRGSDHSTTTVSTHHKHRLTSSPSTPIQKSPAKRRKIAISVHQKQALIDNLQLESKSSSCRASRKNFRLTSKRSHGTRSTIASSVQPPSSGSTVENRDTHQPYYKLFAKYENGGCAFEMSGAEPEAGRFAKATGAS